MVKAKVAYYIIQVINGLAVGMFFPIYTLFLEENGLNFYKMSVVNFAYHISSSVLDLQTGWIADKYGRRKLYIVGSFFWATTQFIYGLSTSIPLFILSEFIAAIGNSLKSDTLESWITNVVGEEQNTKIFGTGKTLFTISTMVASIISGFAAAQYGKRVMWFVSGGLFLVEMLIGLLILLRAENATSTKKPQLSDMKITAVLKKVLSHAEVWVILIVVFGTSMANKAIFMYWPQIAKGLGMPEKQLGMLNIVVTVSIVIGASLAGNKILFTPNMLGMFFLSVCLGSGLWLAGNANTLIQFLQGYVLVEIYYGAANVVILSRFNAFLEDATRSTGNSLKSSVHTLGGGIGLLLFGKIALNVSPQYAVVASSYVVAVVSVVCLFGILLTWNSEV